MPAIIASEPMRELMRLVERVALTSASVLITGESGCGKELVARALHHHSLRCTKPWVDVNCAALPEHLIESELFGYEKGAFSGAEAIKPGLFELAHAGSLFLDEIGELEPRMQVKLLRILDGMPYYRLGGARKITVDVRILAATNQDLESAMRAGKMRRDLYHRLNQVHIRVPPLRERPDDIAVLAEFLLRQHNPGCRFSAEALDVLRGYNWPGNVRELRNVVTRSSIAARDLEIRAADLPPEIRPAPATRHPAAPGSLDAMERQMIHQVLAQTNGHQRQAADVLGISARTLSRKLKLYATQEVAESCVG